MATDRPLILLTWRDAWCGQAAYDPDHAYTSLETQDIGWLVEENDDGVVMCSSRCASNNIYRSECFVPWGMIVRMEELT